MKRTIIITGSTGKFGKVFVKYFLEKGDNVIAIGRSTRSLNQIKPTNKNILKNLFLIKADLMNLKSIGNIIKSIKIKKLNPDCLINNAKKLKFLNLKNKGEVSSVNFLNEFKLGVIVPYELTIKLISEFQSIKNIVNIGSIYGSKVPNMNIYKNGLKTSPINYGVTKAALEHLTKELAVRYAKKKIRINCIAYGGVEGRSSINFKKKYSLFVPMGRMLREEEIPGPVDFILSQKTSGMTGHILKVDGGLTL